MAPGINHSPTFLAPASLLYAISLLLSTARIYFRIKPRLLLRWDDYTLLLTMVSAS